MALKYIDSRGVLTVPGAYASVEVKNNPSGNATTGTIALVGEADAGPRFSEETKLADNKFGPDAINAIIAKYKSGPLVDAARGAISASNDPGIQGSVNRLILVKTNASDEATGSLPAIGSGTWAELAAKLAGPDGNLISRTVTELTAEVIPTSGATVLAPPQQSTVVHFRVNGAAVQTTTIAATTLPSAMVSAINALTGVAATGGANRSVITVVAGNLSVTVTSGHLVHFDISTSWNAVPTAGDILYVPTGSPFAAANEGTYVVTSATTTRINAYKLLDAAGTGADITPPTTEAGPLAVAAATNIQAFSPVVITIEAGAVSPGLGKSLEVAESGSENFNDIAFTFVSATATTPAVPATWVSTAARPYALTSSAEYAVNLNIARQSDNSSETIASPSGVVLTIGYTGTTATAVIDSNTMTITVTGGSGVSPPVINLTTYSRISNLCDYINSLTGFTAAPATVSLGSKFSANLDPGTYTFATEHGALVGRIKQDGQRFRDAINDDSLLLSVSTEDDLVGLPDVSSIAFLSGGAKGGTTNADVLAALNALRKVRCNFVDTLFSCDADTDIDDSLTESTSTYDIASVNANLKSHILQMSQFKERRPRQGFASFRGTYLEAKTAAGNQSQARISMCFQDCKDTNSAGSIVQFRPWMLAVKASGMQAAGGYRPIVGKFINCSGVLQAANDFDDQLNSDLEDALDSGLLFATQDEAGGFRWVSDQTTYTQDDNFVFNSIQAMYACDVIATTSAYRIERAFLGQNVADVPATTAKTAFQRILNDLRRQKWIVATPAAPEGFINDTIDIAPPAMVCSAEVKVGTGLYFFPISFLATPAQSSA